MDVARAILTRVNYYRLLAYMLTLKENDLFKENVTFEYVYRLYEFDKKLRQLLFGVLESVEIAFRTHIAYHLAHKYGPLGYEKSENFVNEYYHKAFLDELSKPLQKKKELFILHHHKKYAGKFPIWVAVEVMSFGVLSKLYANMKPEDKKSIAKEYYGVPYRYMESWLRTLAYVRNICAHYGRLYNKNLVYKLKFCFTSDSLHTCYT